MPTIARMLWLKPKPGAGNPMEVSLVSGGNPVPQDITAASSVCTSKNLEAGTRSRHQTQVLQYEMLAS